MNSSIEDTVEAIKELFIKDISNGGTNYFIVSMSDNDTMKYIWASVAGVHITEGPPIRCDLCVSRKKNPIEFYDLIKFIDNALMALKM